jgi:hypothetical protein
MRSIRASRAAPLRCCSKMFPGLGAAALTQTKARTQESRMHPDKHESPRAASRLPQENEPKRRGFGQVVVRPLDPTIRSQTVLEHDLTTIVINSLHPLFLKRGGDIWYQLETAAREVFKTLEGATVADYERRVNELVLLAFKLRARRRAARSRKSAAQLQLIG